MQKRLIAPIILLLMTVLLFGCTGTTSQGNGTTSGKSSVMSATDLTKAIADCKVCDLSGSVCTVSNTSCLFDKMSSESDCEKLSDYVKTEVNIYADKSKNFAARDIEECFNYWALKKNDAALCNKLTDATNCFETIAVATSNYSLCLDSPSKTDCINHYVTEKKVLSPCKDNLIKLSLQEEISCKSTYSNSAGVPETCKNEFSNNIDNEIDCVLQKIEVTKSQLTDANISICSLLSSPSLPCMVIEAISANDPKVCDKDKEADFANKCYFNLAKISKICTLEVCNKAGQVFSDCYTGIAIREKDPVICTNYARDSGKDWCYTEVAKAAQNIGYCISVTDKTLAQNCIAYVTDIKCPDDKNCNLTKDDCSAIRAIVNKQQLEPTWNNPDNCYYKVAIKNLDIDACNQMLNQQSKQECLDILAHS